ncbi:MAG: FHA domain-containing protein [Myxococcales bacterium]|nr:FHA domain-containing protein [Myxococcales bacterium]
MIVCQRCGKENQDHYKFCLGCGADLPRASERPKSFSTPTPPSGVPAPTKEKTRSSNPPKRSLTPAIASAASPPPSASSTSFAAVRASGAPRTCPECEASVPATFKFCGTCGHDMSGVAASVVPPAPQAAAPKSPPPQAPAAVYGRLVLIRPDGSEGEAFSLAAEETVVGREAGGPFASDAYLSPRHAQIRFHRGQAIVTDLESLNGVYIRLQRDVPVELTDGSIFRIGQEIVRFETLPEPEPLRDGTVRMGSPNPGYVGRICLVTGRETHGNCYTVPLRGMYLGRERGDVIFPDDGYVSGLHARIHPEGERVLLTDVGSSNGTFFRIEGEMSVPAHSLLLMGQQLFRLEY